MPKPKKHHELIALLRGHDDRFQIDARRGKGSHYGITHPDVSGLGKRSIVVPFHGSRDIPPRILAQIIRRFNLPRDIFG